jgi:hypothetical protein
MYWNFCTLFLRKVFWNSNTFFTKYKKVTKFRSLERMFEKMTFVLKCVHSQEMGHDGDNGSSGRPESVAPEILSWRRTEVKLSPPKVAENSKLAVSSFHYTFVLGEMRRNSCLYLSMTRLVRIWRLGRCGIDCSKIWKVVTKGSHKLG